MSLFKLSPNLYLSILVLAACSTEPQIVDLSNTASPQEELSRVNLNIAQAESNQVNILSPKNFEAAKKSRDEAIEGRAENKEQKKVLHKISLAQAYLDKANRVADVANQILKEPIMARKDALDAKSVQLFPQEMLEADRDFKKLTEQIESNDTSGAERKKDTLAKVYRDLELKAIKKDKLDVAKNNIDEATKEGAKKLTPETLAWANKKYLEDEAAIENNRHNVSEVNRASEDATATSERLLKMVRIAKGSTVQKPEDFAKLNEKNEQATIESENMINQGFIDLSKSENEVAKSSDQNKKLQSQVWLDKEFDLAQSQFTKDEAEVYKQGDTILLRLKGLSFENNKSVIKSKNFPLLAKVQKIIGSVGASQIIIEGHTDSIGGQKVNESLSKQRAESVQSYLVANNNVAQERITATGYGYSKPIATNKTAEGRAQNRRVDVIITSVKAME